MTLTHSSYAPPCRWEMNLRRVVIAQGCEFSSDMIRAWTYGFDHQDSVILATLFHCFLGDLTLLGIQYFYLFFCQSSLKTVFSLIV